uniref:Uncharacterized protein n=1 Tax=Picea glauca TaxID=3330 RepID=A0A101LU86_PICGL|nr:hypothetical protein ABT39_MTgene3561 [Picea glauca]
MADWGVWIGDWVMRDWVIWVMRTECVLDLSVCCTIHPHHQVHRVSNGSFMSSNLGSTSSSVSFSVMRV